MRMIISAAAIALLTSCAAMPSLFQAVDDIATDDCITVKVDRDAFKRKVDVKVYVEVVTKD